MGWTESDYQAALVRMQSGSSCKPPTIGAPVTQENSLHDDIFDECTRRGWVAFHGSMAARTHRTLGEPDFIILADGGRTLLIECKSAKGKLSPDQQAIRVHADHLGHTIHVVRSFAEFLDVIRTAHRPQLDASPAESSDSGDHPMPALFG